MSPSTNTPMCIRNDTGFLLPLISDFVGPPKYFLHMQNVFLKPIKNLNGPEMDKPTTVAIVDANVLYRAGIASLITSFPNYRMLYEVNSGKELLEMMQDNTIPEIIILGHLNEGPDCFEMAETLRVHYPASPILALTMYHSDLAMIRLFQSGVKGILKADINTKHLYHALQSVVNTGYFYCDITYRRITSLFYNAKKGENPVERAMLKDVELEFLKLCCTDLTYLNIAGRLGVSVRNVDTMRDKLFHRFDVRSRVGLAMVAIRNGLVYL